MTTPNADITLYHKEYDAEKRDYTYTPNQFPGVFWYGGQGVTLSSGGLKDAVPCRCIEIKLERYEKNKSRNYSASQYSRSSYEPDEPG